MSGLITLIRQRDITGAAKLVVDELRTLQKGKASMPSFSSGRKLSKGKYIKILGKKFPDATWGRAMGKAVCPSCGGNLILIPKKRKADCLECDYVWNAKKGG